MPEETTATYTPIKKQDGSCTKSDHEISTTFAEHFSQVFNPSPAVLTNEEAFIYKFLDAPLQLSKQIRPFSYKEINHALNKIHQRKSAGYDLLNALILRNLPTKAIAFITSIFNAVLRTGQWKIAQVVLIHKPGKPTHEPTSYRSISLLPILSKVVEKLLLVRLFPMISSLELTLRSIIPNLTATKSATRGHGYSVTK